MYKDAPLQTGDPVWRTWNWDESYLCPLFDRSACALGSDFVQLSVYFSTLFSSWCSSGWTPAVSRYGMDSSQLLAIFPQLIIQWKETLFFPMIASSWPDFEEHAYLAPVPLASSLISCLGHLLWPELSPLFYKFIYWSPNFYYSECGCILRKVFKDVIKVKWGLMGGLSSSLTDGLLRRH